MFYILINIFQFKNYTFKAYKNNIYHAKIELFKKKNQKKFESVKLSLLEIRTKIMKSTYN